MVSNHEKNAVKAYHRLLEIRTAGWDEAEHLDAKFDGGEYSGKGWSNEWSLVDEQTHSDVARQFGITVERLYAVEAEVEYLYNWNIMETH